LISPEIRHALAPTGRLRAAVNFANTIVVQRDRGDGQAGGVAVELARELARRLDFELDLTGFDNPAEVIDALGRGAADICFVAFEPARTEMLDFTEPYALIESTYLVPTDSAIRQPSDVDQPGVRIAVMKGAAFDLHLTRVLMAAELVRGGCDYLDVVACGEADVAAGIRQTLEAFADANPGLRVMPEHFATVGQAIATQKANPGAKYLRSFVNDMKVTGFVADALAASAPPFQQRADLKPLAPRGSLWRRRMKQAKLNEASAENIDTGPIALLLAKFSNAVDRKRPKDVSSLFVPDSVFQPADQPIVGPSAIEAFYDARMSDERRRTRHVWSNLVVHPVSEGRAEFEAILTNYAFDPMISVVDLHLRVINVWGVCAGEHPSQWRFETHFSERIYAAALPLMAAPLPLNKD
jgi:polar amino acid transport system substrate-binding protein